MQTLIQCRARYVPDTVQSFMPVKFEKFSVPCPYCEKTIAFTQFLTRLEKADLTKLSPTERKVAVLYARGGTLKEIGIVIGCTAKTVESHRQNVYKRLEVHTQLELVFALIARIPTAVDSGGGLPNVHRPPL